MPSQNIEKRIVFTCASIVMAIAIGNGVAAASPDEDKVVKQDVSAVSGQKVAWLSSKDKESLREDLRSERRGSASRASSGDKKETRSGRRSASQSALVGGKAESDGAGKSTSRMTDEERQALRRDVRDYNSPDSQSPDTAKPAEKKQ